MAGFSLQVRACPSPQFTMRMKLTTSIKPDEVLTTKIAMEPSLETIKYRHFLITISKRGQVCKIFVLKKSSTNRHYCAKIAFL